jgi:hypothetical protein
MPPVTNRELSRETLAIMITEIVADAVTLAKVTIQSIREQTLRNIEDLAERERRRIGIVIIKAIIAMPLVIIATLFTGAAAVEFLADWYPLPLSALYGVSALLFFMLAAVILLIPIARSKRKESLT